MARLVTIYGGSGFLGRHIAWTMARQGWRVRVACRRPNEALFVRTYGAVGQVEPVPCNVRDEVSVRAAMSDADAVVNCVGILVREGRNTFDSIQDTAAGRIARLSAEMGVAHLVHISAIGADIDSRSAYAASKGRGEAAVLDARPDAVILRPSVIFGQGDGLYNKFAAMSRFGPVVATAGAKTLMQPVYVEDVAAAAAMAASGEVAPGVLELGGPQVLTVREIIGQVLDAVKRRRAVLNLPFWLAGIAGWGFDMVQTVSGGLLTNRIVTRDQVRLLRTDNIVAPDARGFAELGIQPTAPEAIIRDYLWRFRADGQYATMKASAKNLRQP